MVVLRLFCFVVFGCFCDGVMSGEVCSFVLFVCLFVCWLFCFVLCFVCSDLIGFVVIVLCVYVYVLRLFRCVGGVACWFCLLFCFVILRWIRCLFCFRHV